METRDARKGVPLSEGEIRNKKTSWPELATIKSSHASGVLRGTRVAARRGHRLCTMTVMAGNAFVLWSDNQQPPVVLWGPYHES